MRRYSGAGSFGSGVVKIEAGKYYRTRGGGIGGRIGGAEEMTETKTHDYTRRSWGHDFTITEIFNGGKSLDLMGWGHGLFKGDFIILPNKNETTRYVIKSVHYKNNPPDMWQAKVEFAPRARLARDVIQELEARKK